MVIVEYILDPQDKPRSYVPRTIPSYIVHGGCWGHPDEWGQPDGSTGSEKLIGIAKEGSFPDSLKTFTLEELQARQRSIHAKYPMKKYVDYDGNGPDMTNDEVDAVIKAWVDARS